MRNENTQWQNALLRRFAEREDIGKDGLYRLYFKQDGLPRAEVLECLSLIETEFGISAGILRPEDKLDALFEPVPTKNPLRWMVYQVKAGDLQAELSLQLDKRLRQHNTSNDWKHIETVGELIRAWCGQKPRQV